ncbi:MAG: DUF3240 family protein [Dechloromonas sp.]|jgi:nitrogen regulatory protein PII|uniref:DUF3240 family protein n=1 Tax=Candidatus Dechloromonas phosphorivorans TaxID=2899244 RepID=A0A935N291_9RHOO|nr:DUF3240 family protein [Candidatus Dechloromonas phosphorivorans]
MGAQLSPRKLLTIICEASLEHAIVDDLLALDVHGYTISDVRGCGAHGRRDAEWPPSANIRIEVLCAEKTALSLLDHLQENYYANFGMVTFLSDVLVMRPEKF